ncbi:protein CREG1-like [Anoplophora glabripennis]|uniref:protein CREG1-like n=1 Tax=Anoplophora glabripennis TaxID=217634 RepID=UPI000875999C|nr:protein CREG1-like [Anoplophora glabripennis]
MISAKLIVIATLSLCAVGYINAADDVLPSDPALLARYVIHKAEWVSLATISSLKGYTGYPYVSLKSTSDGPKGKPSGIAYLYLTDWETTSKDLEKDDRVTIMASLAQTDYCKKKNIDQQNPICPKVFIIGKIVKLEKSTPEYVFGRNALLEKHPEMKSWPEDHGFYVAKVDPILIRLLGHHGPVKEISKDAYLSADVTSLI